MTTIALAQSPAFRVIPRPLAQPRAPRPEAAHSPALADSYSAMGVRFGLALVPFTALAWLFVAF